MAAIFSSTAKGKLYTLPISGGEPQQLDAGFATNANNDHGFSPDGNWLAISHSLEDEGSKIYVFPPKGGTPRLVTPPKHLRIGMAVRPMVILSFTR